MRFKYKYEHLDCTLCTKMKESTCPHLLCPYIMQNLDDLRHDPAFALAIENAEHLPTPHNPTLLHLKKLGFSAAEPKSVEPAREPYNHGIRPECAGCPYPKVGQFCYGPDGSCVRSDYDAILRKCKPCPA